MISDNNSSAFNIRRKSNFRFHMDFPQYTIITQILPRCHIKLRKHINWTKLYIHHTRTPICCCSPFFCCKRKLIKLIDGKFVYTKIKSSKRGNSVYNCDLKNIYTYIYMSLKVKWTFQSPPSTAPYICGMAEMKW